MAFLLIVPKNASYYGVTSRNRIHGLPRVAEVTSDIEVLWRCTLETWAARLFQQSCAVLSRKAGGRSPRLAEMVMDGKYPPPPLNGTGHDWHHPKAALVQVIKNGSPGAKGNMPAWKGKLNDQEIEDVVAWFQSLWPPEVRTVWERIACDSRR
jgi:hypothetical protein